MRTANYHAIVAHAFRFILGVIFCYAGFTKMEEPQELAVSIESFQLLPQTWIYPVALSLPLLEINLGIWIILGIRLRTSALGITILCLIFTLATGRAWILGFDINCQCFGERSELPVSLIFLRDLALLGASIITLTYTWVMENDLKKVGYSLNVVSKFPTE